MTITVDVLMPAEGDGYAEGAARGLDAYRAAFASHGIALNARPWTAGPGNADATLALFAWGYHFDVARWRTMLADWPVDRPLFNAPALLAWNTRKTYLAELERAGVAIVPSLFGRADADSVAAAFARFGGEELVIKPQVSAGSDRTVRVKRGTPIVPMDDAILQPFLDAIGGEGELSFLFVGGTFSHAVRKVALSGEFRIQPQFGGVFTRFDPDADIALAEQVIAALPVTPLYARVDLIRLADGTLALMEIEAIEPDLYPHLEPALPDRLAEAIRQRLADARDG
ncbi:hypothetical protein ASG11_13110 [Sphingomonas sp. Leaf357]|uniref:ATP-grasp domain-containing protein n=1 Tax=Sphingomonas sp. Leaf357 TaxID=1736350 RepID=UPI0006F9E9FE|nr:hypothetical protein [Sphingomonas sp. Leaf357]KQS01772.1 hypothetical protein ASG11_13110 [Sphingomonas sp. Leaf357]